MENLNTLKSIKGNTLVDIVLVRLDDDSVKRLAKAIAEELKK